MDKLISLNVAAEVAVKVSVVLGVTVLLAMLVWRGSSASIRHGIWSIGLYAAIAVPVFVLVMPGWGVLPAGLSPALPESIGMAPGVPGEVNKEAELPDSSEAAEAVKWVEAPVATSGEAISVEGRGAKGEPFTSWLVGVWLIGVVALLGKMVVSRLVLAWRGRRCEGISDGKVADVFEEVRKRMGLGGKVRVLVSPERVMPMSWGVFSPTILLPAEAEMWEKGRLTSVLFHEMAHLERRDPLHLIWTKLACALYWFHPLVWFAASRQQIESEVACDDRVLEMGVRGSDYATHLLEVVTGSNVSPVGSGMALAMARSKSQLERRVAAAVEPGKNRCRSSRIGKLVSIAVGLGFVVSVSMLSAAPPSDGDGDVEGEAEKREEVEGKKADADRGDGEKGVSPEDYWKSLIANQERMLQLVKAEYEAGRAGIDEMLSAQADVHHTKLGLARLQGDREGELAALKAKVTVAKERLAVARKRYEEGVVTEKAILALQAEVLRAQIELAEAKPKVERNPSSGAGAPRPPGDVGDAKPEDVYLQGYLLFQKGMGLIDKGELEEGVAKLMEAEKLFEFIARNWPSWQRPMVHFRLGTIGREISKATADPDPGAVIRDDFGIRPPPPELYVRDGDKIVKAPAADLVVAGGYRAFGDKGKLKDGQRITIMTAKTKYKVGEEIRVIHVLDAVVSGIEISHVGPKRIFDEYVDGKLVTPPRDAVIEVIRGSIKPSPAVDFLYEITSYSFDEPGEHTIQWKGGGHAHDGDLGLESNVLRIVVEK